MGNVPLIINQEDGDFDSINQGDGDSDSRGFQEFDYFCSETPYMDVSTTLHTKGKYALRLVYDR